MEEIQQTYRALRLFDDAMHLCKRYRHEFVLPEHLLRAMIDDDSFYAALNIFYNPAKLSARVDDFLTDLEHVPDDVDYQPEASTQMGQLIEGAMRHVVQSEAAALDVPHLASALLALPESWAAYLLKDSLNGKEANFLQRLISFCEMDEHLEKVSSESKHLDAWRQWVVCMNDHYAERNPLIGRDEELMRTIQVLCRRDKNNPLHVGEPGVGKTALVWGLAARIEADDVPPRLKGCRIYQLDMATLLAGTQYRGEFEERLKQIVDGIQQEADNNIVYIDEMHTLVGAGATGQGALDASNILKPYLEGGQLRFIGSTTYEEYNRHFARSKGLLRRFQQIDIAEPTVEQAKHIVRQLLPTYADFHGVTYGDAAADYAVEATAKYMHERYLPDKALDLIDEAGAVMEMTTDKRPIDKEALAGVLAKMCKMDVLADSGSDNDLERLHHLAERMLAQIYGQDAAIRQVVEAVQMARAGLLEADKPLASLLFVGPTGVGKTEVARVLAREMGVELVRFDMSEYMEKHAVAKLIGAPAGYVGYDDGGLLTDAIRKTPHCVLLLDEIEKAHTDIYNLLLQVMDYGRLTDNKGRQADFRNVVLIMTSNAGAQRAAQHTMGFSNSVSRGSVMMQQVKRVFRPEFLNRLSGAVVFNDMDRNMATLILQKKLRQLDEQLAARNVTMQLTPEAFDYLLREGFTPEYGAREMDRVIAQRLKPLLMREMLFGTLTKGGNIQIGISDGSLSVG